MRNVFGAYLLCTLGLFGIAGLHRFYLGKPITGFLWLITLGGFYIGTLYDFIVMDHLVDEANRKSLKDQPMPMALPLYVPVNMAGVVERPDKLQDPAVDLELRLLQAARKHQGQLTAPLAAVEVGVSIEEADRKLSAMVTENHATLEITDDGVIVYDFPALRVI